MTDARTTADVLVRLEETEDIMVRSLSSRAAAKEVARKYGLSRRQASTYVRRVVDRWKAESDAGRDAKRARMRAFLEGVAAEGMGRNGVYVSKTGETVEYSDPDIRGAVNCAELLCRLDGLLEQPDAKVSVDVTLFEKLQQHYGLGDHVVDATPAPKLNGSNGHAGG